MISRSWFVLPPAMEYYYRMRNPSYRTLPPFRPGCSDDRQVPSMEFLYPPRDARIFIPRNLQGQMMSMLPEIAHRRRNAVIYWHLDNRYIGMTRHIHQTELRVGEGEHIITATDDEGVTISPQVYLRRTLYNSNRKKLYFYRCIYNLTLRKSDRLLSGSFFQRILAGKTFNRYKEVFDQAGYAIMLIDNRTNRFIKVNRAATELFGYTEEELRKMTPLDLSTEPEETGQCH